jgi:peptidoglycan/LPS O-acetylase OafA/YrhL
MRAWAAWMVVTYHLVAITTFYPWWKSYFPMPLGFSLGVDFFFVLSGYLLSRQFFTGEKVNLKNYYLKRIFRIWPLYYSSFAVVLLIQFFVKHVTYTPFQILATALFAQNFFPSSYEVINPVYWTLAIEELFYVLLPILALIFRPKRAWKLVLVYLLLFAFAYRLYAFEQSSFFISSQFFGFLSNFLLGMTVAKIGNRIRYTAVRYIGVICGIGAMAAVYGLDTSVYLFPLFNPCIAALFALLLAMTLSSKHKFAFTNPVAKWLGKMSYSTYIWHDYMIWMFAYLGTAFLGYPVWVGVYLAAVIAVSYVSWRWIEEPANRFRKKHFGKREELTLAASSLESKIE